MAPLNSAPQEFIAEILEKFYKDACPEKLDNVPAIVSKYKGKYAKLAKAIKAKYPDHCPDFAGLLNEAQSC